MMTDALNNNKEKETVTGAYAQYTFNLDNKFVVMAGLRADHSTLYGTFVTPRLHLKYVPNDIVSFRLSAGKGYRSVHALAENNYLLASGRTLVIDNLRQESAWNYGASAAFNIPLLGKTLRLNTEYYYTRFGNETIIDYDTDPMVIHIANLDGKSYSHTIQVDATYPIFTGMTLSAAYRLNDVKSTYGGKLMERPLTSKYKGLVSASYKTPLGIWQFDATLQINGGCRMPEPYTMSDGALSWDRRFSPYQQVSAQVTRWFRKFSIYVGGENLTNFTQANPILGASDPWGKNFESTMIWGPVHGRMFYAGIRFNLNNN
jgi:outer membrane receptor protein involved in Fe transport